MRRKSNEQKCRPKKVCDILTAFPTPYDLYRLVRASSLKRRGYSIANITLDLGGELPIDRKGNLFLIDSATSHALVKDFLGSASDDAWFFVASASSDIATQRMILEQIRIRLQRKVTYELQGIMVGALIRSLKWWKLSRKSWKSISNECLTLMRRWEAELRGKGQPKEASFLLNELVLFRRLVKAKARQVRKKVFNYRP